MIVKFSVLLQKDAMSSITTQGSRIATLNMELDTDQINLAQFLAKRVNRVIPDPSTLAIIINMEREVNEKLIWKKMQVENIQFFF